MEREPEFDNEVEMPKFCPECGGEFVTMRKIPHNIDPQDILDFSTELLEEARNVCTMCGYEESAEDTVALLNGMYWEEWQEINNALPEVTVPRKVSVQRHLYVLRHHPFPDGYVYLYHPLLLAEIVAAIHHEE